MNLWNEPYLVAFVVISISFTWCAWTVYKMKKSFDERGGSYKPLTDLLTPEWMKQFK
ncbi:MAG: hypothetical protein WC319_15660 [Candidatus Paceibacterota bacterium]|jgi:hypothetical protein